ncbi:MAG: hypothetical protein HFACDABA_01088 [Anaerolineales bacterium]|nr:hypothetical protein [Anaerolineales bacterium]
MSKLSRVLFVFLIVLFILACGSAPQATVSPVPTIAAASQIPENIPSIVPHEPTQNSTQPAAQPSGLKVAYTLDGNLWFWSETTPARQITHEGSAGMFSLSDDGQVIAYTRGQTLWAVNSDGSNARELVADVPALTGRPFLGQLDFQPGTHILYFSAIASVQGQYGDDLHRVDADAPAAQTLIQQGGGKFTFSPNGALLALTTVNRINVLRVDNPTLVSALDFPQVNTNADWSYYPQVVWLNDSSGFYTVIPGNDGQKARFLYVAANGSFTAQLAEFAIADIRVGQPLIAPNGSKVAYLTATDDSFDFHVIDASTADKTIGTYPRSSQFGLWAWSLDSARFTYWTDDPSRLFIASVTSLPAPLLDRAAPYSLTWVDADRFLYIAEGELRLGQAGVSVLAVLTGGYQPGEQGSSFDFAP